MAVASQKIYYNYSSRCENGSHNFRIALIFGIDSSAFLSEVKRSYEFLTRNSQHEPNMQTSLKSSSDTSSKLPHHRGFLTITIHFLLFTFQIVLLANEKEKGMPSLKAWKTQHSLLWFNQSTGQQRSSRICLIKY